MDKMPDWKALLGRVTLFPGTPSDPPSALALYSKVWGGDPDSFQRQTNILIPNVAQGKRFGMSVSCSVHPTRIDLSLEPLPVEAAPQPSLAMMTDTIELKKRLLEIVQTVAKGVVQNQIVRVALYLQFLTIATEVVEANKIITGAIPNRYGVKITDEVDFVFQINQRQPSKQIPDVSLNVLTKWSVDRIQVFRIAIPVPGVPIQPVALAPQNATIFIAPTVVLDNSTPAEQTSPFDAAQQYALLMDSFTFASARQKELSMNIAGF